MMPLRWVCVSPLGLFLWACSVSGFKIARFLYPLLLFLLAGWMAYPALTPGFKESLGLPSDERVVVNVKYEEVEIDQTPQLA